MEAPENDNAGADTGFLKVRGWGNCSVLKRGSLTCMFSFPLMKFGGPEPQEPATPLASPALPLICFIFFLCDGNPIRLMEASHDGGVELSIYTRDNDSSRETIPGTVVNKGMVISYGEGRGGA